jgi:hypothetical protein
LSTDGIVIQELIQKYGEHGARRIINTASNYFWEQDRKKEEEDRKEILEHPHVLAYIKHFKSWINAEIKKAGYEMYKTQDRIDFEGHTYEMGWSTFVNVKFEYGICFIPKDLKKKSFLTTDREIREFRWDLPYRFAKTHRMLDYEPLSKDNQFGQYLCLGCDVYELSSFSWPWTELNI